MESAILEGMLVIGYEEFICELVVEDTDEGLEVPSISFSSVLSLSSLSYMSSGLSGPVRPLPGLEAKDTLGKYPGNAPGNRLDAGCLDKGWPPPNIG
jgi:hypothetical protein